MQLPIQQCPSCGCKEFVVGHQHQEARITTSPNGIFGCRVKYLICAKCGAILHSKIAEPQKYPKATIYNY